jgi:8-oxo-dGTP pyrophosphatase MutT (NUDIX family)
MQGMADEEQAAVVQPVDPHEGEVFDLEVEPNDALIELFELHFPRPPQGTWKEKFDIRADVRFAYMTLKFDNVSVRAE